MKCCICQKGIRDVGALFRINAYGVPGIWACRQHLKQTDAPPIDATVNLVLKALGQ